MSWPSLDGISWEFQNTNTTQPDYFLSVKHQKRDTTDAGAGYFSKACLQELLGLFCN